MTEMMERLISVLQEKAPGSQGLNITENTVLRADLGLDSLRMVELMVALEEEFNIVFDESDLNPGELQSVSDLLAIVKRTGEVV